MRERGLAVRAELFARGSPGGRGLRERPEGRGPDLAPRGPTRVCLPLSGRRFPLGCLAPFGRMSSLGGGDDPDGRKEKSTMHWVSAAHAVEATVRLYDRLFDAEGPGDATGDVFDDLNDASVEELTDCKLEPSLADTPMGEVVQFERLGYFAADPTERMLFHRTVGLRDEWANIQKRS